MVYVLLCNEEDMVEESYLFVSIDQAIYPLQWEILN